MKWPLQVWQIRFRDGEGEVLYDVLHEDGSVAEDLVRPFLKWYTPIYGDNPDALLDEAELVGRIDRVLAGGGALSQHALVIGTLSVNAREVLQVSGTHNA